MIIKNIDHRTCSAAGQKTKFVILAKACSIVTIWNKNDTAYWFKMFCVHCLYIMTCNHQIKINSTFGKGSVQNTKIKLREK